MTNTRIVALVAAVLVMPSAVAAQGAPPQVAPVTVAEAQGAAAPVRVRFETDLGSFEVEVDVAHAPVTAANFLKYVDGGFYDGGQVHRSARLETQATRPVKIEVIQASINRERSKDQFPAIPLERTSRHGPDTQGCRDLDGPQRAGYRPFRLLHLHWRSGVARLWRCAQPGWPGLCRIRASGGRHGRCSRHPPGPSRGRDAQAPGSHHERETTLACAGAGCGLHARASTSAIVSPLRRVHLTDRDLRGALRSLTGE